MSRTDDKIPADKIIAWVSVRINLKKKKKSGSGSGISREY